jgi:hypothetical protein
MISVYHKIKSDFFTTANKFVAQEFTLVAKVNTNDLEEAYRLTNTVDHYWWENEGVNAVITKTRSTSVGDVMLDHKDGKFHAVASCGFAEIGAA